MTVVLTGGGTGGHIYPALAIGAALEKRGASLLFIGNEEGLESRLVPKHGVRFEGIMTKGFGPHGLKEFVAGTVAVVRGMWQANRCLRRGHVQAIVGTGGYASASVVLVGALRGIPVVLHEPNAVAGKANRWLGIFSSRIALGFPESGDLLPARKCVVTGVAVRSSGGRIDKAEARRILGLDPDRPMLLVAGGSQGAVALNETLMASLDGIEALGLQVLHQTGAGHFDEVARAESERRPHYHAVPYIDDMPAAYSAADAAVCRAGASTVAELALYGVPAVLVPFPHAADDHQRGNAGVFARAGAAFSLDQKEMTPDKLCALVETICREPNRSEMSEAMARVARPNASDDIARIVLSLAESGSASASGTTAPNGGGDAPHDRA